MGDFHIRLQKAMDKAGIKQSELCEKTGIGKSSISQYLSGEYEPKQKNIYKIATALNVAPSYLLGYTNDFIEKNETTDYSELIKSNILDTFIGAGPVTKDELLKHLLTPEEQEAIKIANSQKYTDLISRNLNQTNLPLLTPKDEREIAKDLEAMLDALDNQSGMAAYNDSEDDEDRELLKASLEYSMRLAKQLAKKKFTPKKYRKE